MEIQQMEKIKVTLTAKLKLNPTSEQVDRLLQTLHAYRQACNRVSQTIFVMEAFHVIALHNLHYRELRADYNLRSQMLNPSCKPSWLDISQRLITVIHGRVFSSRCLNMIWFGTAIIR